jgi:hypothetical protein
MALTTNILLGLESMVYFLDLLHTNLFLKDLKKTPCGKIMLFSIELHH